MADRRTQPRRIAAAVLLVAAVIGVVNITGRGSSGDGVLLDISEEEANGIGPYKVTRVIDGDTIVIDRTGSIRVRILGIDTPETVAPGRPVECGGKEATAWARRSLTGQTVRLYPDTSQDERDRYGRLLAYVELPNGTDYGLVAIQRGHAREYTFETAHSRQKSYRAAQAKARRGDRGLWHCSPPR